MKLPSLRRSGCAVLLAPLLASCALLPPAPPPPRLVVMLIIDGLPQRQVIGYRDQLAPDGFARFLERGAWYSEAHHGHGFTVTCSGHATLATGTSAHRHGIIGNEWRDRRTGAVVDCGGDPDAQYIGHPTQDDEGTSPRHLQAETVADVLRRTDPRAQVVAISGKDRGAIMSAGRSGTAYMYMARSGQFASSTYYMQRHPAWVDAFNAAKPADRWFKTEWRPLLPEAAYARSLPDDQRWYGPAGGKLPMLMGAPADTAPGPGYYGGLLPSPYADTLALEFARAAIAAEQLGRDDVPDLLVISLSGHDYVNHRWSPDSRMSHDHLLRLDRLLEAFFRDLDGAVGRDHYAAVLSSDHGFMSAPEVIPPASGSGRITGSQLLARINAQLEARFGVPRLVRFFSASALVLDRQLMADRGLDAEAVLAAARDAVLAEPGIAAAYTRTELASGSRAGAPWFAQLRRSWHAEVSGDVQYTVQPQWMFGSAGATHGSPHRYDTHVPLMLWGPRWVRAGRVDARVETTSVAPTLARLLGVAAPAASEGRPLPLR